MSLYTLDYLGYYRVQILGEHAVSMFCLLPLKYPYGRLGIVNCVQAKGVYTYISKPVWILATTDVSDTDQEHNYIVLF